MKELDEEARALLKRYREVTTPDDAAVEQALARTLTRSESERTTARLVSRTGSARWLSAAAILLVLGAAGVAYAQLRFGWLSERGEPAFEAQHQAIEQVIEQAHERESATTPSPGISPLELELPEAEPSGNPSESPTAAPSSAASVIASPPDSKRLARPPDRQRDDSSTEPTIDSAATPEPPSPTATERSGDLADESRLLTRARKALAQGDYALALEWTEEHGRRHPDGLLAAERMLVQAAALCQSGQLQEGRATLEQLRREYPGIPALTQVGIACGS